MEFAEQRQCSRVDTHELLNNRWFIDILFSLIHFLLGIDFWQRPTSETSQTRVDNQTELINYRDIGIRVESWVQIPVQNELLTLILSRIMAITLRFRRSTKQDDQVPRGINQYTKGQDTSHLQGTCTLLTAVLSWRDEEEEPVCYGCHHHCRSFPLFYEHELKMVVVNQGVCLKATRCFINYLAQIRNHLSQSRQLSGKMNEFRCLSSPPCQPGLSQRDKKWLNLPSMAPHNLWTPMRKAGVQSWTDDGRQHNKSLPQSFMFEVSHEP